MKTKSLSLFAGIFIFGLSSLFAQEIQPHKSSMSHNSTNEKSETPKAFKKQLGDVLTEYYVLKDALVASDKASAEAAANKTLKALHKVDMKQLKGSAHMKWMEQQKAIESNLNGIVQMEGLEMKRSHFNVVSDNLSAAIKSFGVETNEVVYVDFCPMANNNKGAYWLSAGKEIRNPYYGDKMLTCGEVREVIK